jgi:hypothetical protein
MIWLVFTKSRWPLFGKWIDSYRSSGNGMVHRQEAKVDRTRVKEDRAGGEDWKTYVCYALENTGLEEVGAVARWTGMPLTKVGGQSEEPSGRADSEFRLAHVGCKRHLAQCLTQSTP